MKSWAEIKESIAYNPSFAYGPAVPGWSTTPGIHNTADPQAMARLNSFVGAIADTEYLDPMTPIRALRNFLLRIGMVVDGIDGVVPDDGDEWYFPVYNQAKPIGYAKDANGNTDGWSFTTHDDHDPDMVLVVTFDRNESNRWMLTASLTNEIPADDSGKTIDESTATVASQKVELFRNDPKAFQSWIEQRGEVRGTFLLTRVVSLVPLELEADKFRSDETIYLHTRKANPRKERLIAVDAKSNKEIRFIATEDPRGNIRIYGNPLHPVTIGKN